MNYPEDSLFKLIEVYNPNARVNRNTVYLFRDRIKKLPKTNQFKYQTIIYAHPNQEYYGEETISYDKYDMTKYSKLHPLVVPATPGLRGWDLIDAIEKQYGFTLRKEDIVNSKLTYNRGVKIANQCILYEGIIQVVYEGSIELSDLIKVTDLNGFHLEI